MGGGERGGFPGTKLILQSNQVSTFGGEGLRILDSGEGDKSSRESITIYVLDRLIEVPTGGIEEGRDDGSRVISQSII